MPDPSVFGKRLKAIRERRGWTQAELETRSGVPAVMISHFETGVRQSASIDTLLKLANALEVSIDYLVGRTDDPSPVGGKVAAVLRTLGESSGETLDAVIAVAESLLERDREKRDR